MPFGVCPSGLRGEDATIEIFFNQRMVTRERCECS